MLVEKKTASDNEEKEKAEEKLHFKYFRFLILFFLNLLARVI